MRGFDLPSRRLVSQDESAIVQDPTVPRSRFHNRWEILDTFNAGDLVPFLVEPILPGDHMRYKVSPYVRLSTPLFPIFSNQSIDTFFFFVPMRLIWENWERFMGAQDTPGDSIDFTIPHIESPVGGHPVNSIWDHLGIPCVGQIDAGTTIYHNVLPARAYNLIFNTWFRDENLVADVTVELGNGPDTLSWYQTKKRAKAHDYFTSALPWPQKFTAPTVPVAGQAPVLGIGFADGGVTPVGPVGVFESDMTASTFLSAVQASAAGEVYVKNLNNAGDDYPQVFADLSLATGVSINTLRQAWMVQSLLERDARGGTRYVELIKHHFRVTSPDFRLQRPEYIGGGRSPLNITPIAQTAPTAGVPLGALGAAGTAVGQHTASYAATEHGYIIGLINVRSELAYQQGMHRLWSAYTRYDFPFPELMGLGEQAILRKEIFANGIDAEDDLVFGYQERFHEWRTRYSQVRGMFRSTTALGIDQWHLAQEFTPTAPLLNETFINDTPPMTRILAAGGSADNMQYLADILVELDAIRPISVYGTPAQIGRF